MKNGFIWNRKDKSLLFFPVAFLLAVMPFVVRATEQFIQGDLYQLFSTNRKTEIFAQYRARFLWIMAAVMLILFFVYTRKLLAGIDRLDLLYMGFCGVLVLFTVLSTVCSAHPDTAMWGLYDRAEGMVTQICYLILFLYTALAYRTSHDLKLFMAAVAVLIAVNAIMGISQFIGHDLFTTDWVNRLVVPDYMSGKISPLQFNKAKMYGTTNHYDYLGSVAAMIFPVCTVLALFEKKWKFRIPAIIAAAFSLMLLLGSTSRAGLVGTAVAIILGMIFFRYFLLRYWKIVLSIFAGLLAVTIGLDFVLHHAIFERVPMLLADIQTIFSDTSDFDYKDTLPIRGVENREDGAVIFLQEDCLHLSVQDGTFIFRNQNGKDVLYTENGEGVLETSDGVFAQFSFQATQTFEGACLYLIYNGQNLLRFYYDETQIYLVRKNTAEKMTLEDPPVAGFLKGKELIGSMRGYIWSRTIPLLPEHLLIGAGPDCFIFEFPQDDVLGKLYAYGIGSIVVDKPHNVYLQIFINEGGVALLAFLAICFVYLWDCFRLYGGKNRRETAFRGVAVALGVIGYLFAGFFNDSIIVTSVIFWILLGIGVGINRQYRRESENQ